MAHAVQIPPPGFDDLAADEKIRYVQELWDRVASSPEAVPVPDWHRQVLCERLEAYQSNPKGDTRWSEVRNGLLRELADSKRSRG